MSDKAMLLAHLKVFVAHLRTDVYAQRVGNNGSWRYEPVHAPINDDLLRAHLEDGPHLGGYFLAPGSDKTKASVLDFDNHDGRLSWEEVRAAALAVAQVARGFGLSDWPSRSGSGSGIHLAFRWDEFQSAADVRALAGTVLAAAGFTAGTKGLAEREVEVFPKQDHVALNGLGNLIAYPFCRQSVPLDSEMNEIETPMNFISSVPVKPQATPERKPNGAAPTADADALRSALATVAADDYGVWIKVGLALKHDLGDAGLELWREWSAKSEKYPGPEAIQKKWRTFKPRSGEGTISCGSIFHWAKEAGWVPPVRPVTEERPPWPEPLGEAAYYGLAGEIVRAIEPHTEADPVALLVQSLVAFGNIIGRGSYYYVDGVQHHANLFAVLVGKSARGRKGTAWARVREVIVLEDNWLRERTASGLSTGEGLIDRVRDATVKQVKDKEGNVTEETIDAGVFDKRLLIHESEFSRTLRVMSRSDNTLSAIIRDAWDGNTLRVMTRKSPLIATDPHISVVAHATIEDLTQYLNATEAANGFGNRFLYLCVQRSKLLPFGGNNEELRAKLPALQLRFQRVAEAAAGIRQAGVDAPAERQITWADDAHARWAEVYEQLSTEQPGLYGAITARAEAQAVRLALIYTLLDGEAAIRLPHLEAALAIWKYCEQSARHIFGDSLGNPIADQMLRVLRAAGPKGMTRTEISAAFGRHSSAAEIGRALTMLARAGRVAVEERAATGGRPAEAWRAV